MQHRERPLMAAGMQGTKMRSVVIALCLASMLAAWKTVWGHLGGQQTGLLAAAPRRLRVAASPRTQDACDLKGRLHSLASGWQMLRMVLSRWLPGLGWAQQEPLR